MRLIRSVKGKSQKQMAQMIFISSQMLMMHANDLLDSRIIQQGNFAAVLSPVDVYETILEMVQIVRFNQAHRQVKIEFK